jgi:hypothetical protein
MGRVVGPAAALAGLPAGVQAQGAWVGRRQLFIRFAAEAETAVLYTADALAQELRRLAARASVHSVAVSGRDPLGNAEYLCAAFDAWTPTLPIMLDTDGQRPDALETMKQHLALVQVTVDTAGADAMMERALQTLVTAARTGCQHALVLAPKDDASASDGRLLRIVEQAHAASTGTMIVLHPTLGTSGVPERRWASLLEQASALHQDVRIVLKLPPPLGLR